MSLHRYIRNTPSDRSARRTPAESRQEYLTSGKEYIDPQKLGRKKKLGGETGVLLGWTCAWRVGELKQESNPHIGATVWVRGETFKAESETADLWQPKWNENQTVLAAAIHAPDRNAGPLESAAAGSWSLGIVAQSQGEGCCWLWREGLRECEGGDCSGNYRWRKARQLWKQGNTAESGMGVEPSLSPHTPASAAEQ